MRAPAIAGEHFAKAGGEILRRRRGVEAFRIARAGEHDAARGAAAGLVQQVGVAGFPAIIAALRHRAEGAAGEPVERGGLRAELAAFPHWNHQAVGLDRRHRIRAHRIPHHPLTSCLALNWPRIAAAPEY